MGLMPIGFMCNLPIKKKEATKTHKKLVGSGGFVGRHGGCQCGVGGGGGGSAVEFFSFFSFFFFIFLGGGGWGCLE
jgi:hypothetical protein